MTYTVQAATTKAVLLGTVNGHDLHEGDMGSVYATLPGVDGIEGRAWGPAADRTGNWFCYRIGEEPIRVESYDAAIAHITGGAA